MVQQITLDSLALMEDVAFVKVDIEGMELDFFKGAVNTLKSNNYPPIFSEIWEFKWYRESAIEIEKFLQSMGYKLTRFGKDIVAQHPAHKCQIQFHEEKKGLNITVTDNI